MTRRMMKALFEIAELHHAARKGWAMPKASNTDTRDKPSAASNASEYYDIGGHSEDDNYDEGEE